MKLSVSASRGGNAKTDCSFAFGVEGSAGDTPCPHASALRLRGTGKAANLPPGTPEIHCILVHVCYPALAHFTQKNAEKVSLKKLFALPECLPSETQKGGHEAAFEMSVSRQGKRQTAPSAVPDEAEAVVERLTVSPSRCQSEWRMMKSFTSASLTPAARASRDTVIGSPLPNMYSEP